MGKQTTALDRSDHGDLSVISATALMGRPWWLAACSIGLLIGFVIIARTLTLDRKVSATQDDIRIVKVGPILKGPSMVYNYQSALKVVPPVSGQVSVSGIDDTSSEQTYIQSCLAALTRGNNPEIMQLPEAERDEMCTDPRRK